MVRFLPGPQMLFKWHRSRETVLEGICASESCRDKGINERLPQAVAG